MAYRNSIALCDTQLDAVRGGSGCWTEFASGSFEDFGNYIVYTTADGDVLCGIAIRFGVTVDAIQNWNTIPDSRDLDSGQKLTIYPRTLR